MKKILGIILLLLFVFSGITVLADEVLTINGEEIKHLGTNDNVYIADEKTYELEEMRGVWVSTVWNGDFGQASTVSAYKSQFSKVLDKLESININTILFQIRPNNDAYYKSELNPWSKWLRGYQGKAITDPDTNEEWDPLAYMIEETHKRGMKFFGWLNAYRVSYSTLFSNNSNYEDDETVIAKVEETLNGLDDKNFAKRNKDMILVGDSDSKIILNPGEPKVQNFVMKSVQEIVSNYDIDGVHFDDYFYLDSTNSSKAEKVVNTLGEYTEADTAFNDNYSDYNTYIQYRDNNETLADFRRRSVNKLISSISKMIKMVNEEQGKTVEFGAKPAAVWTSKGRKVDGRIEGANVYNYAYSSYFDIYADSLLWAEKGWVDWIAPQVYFNFKNTEVPYADIVEWWANAITEANKKLKEENDYVKLYIAHGFYRLSSGETSVKKITDSEEIMKQLLFNEKFDVIQGSAYYDYSTIASSSTVVKETIENMMKLYNKKTIPNISNVDDNINGFLRVMDDKIKAFGSLFGAVLYNKEKEVVDIVYNFNDVNYTNEMVYYKLISKNDEISERFFELKKESEFNVKSINNLTDFIINDSEEVLNIAYDKDMNVEVNGKRISIKDTGIVYLLTQENGILKHYMIIVNEPKFYKLTLPKGEGFIIEASITDEKILENSEVILNIKLDDNYNKSNYYLKVNNKKYLPENNSVIIKITKDTKVEIFDVTANKYKITYHDVNYEDDDYTNVDKFNYFVHLETEYDYGNKIENINLTKEHYTLEGWYTDVECTNKYDFDSLVSNDFALYPKFIPNIYKVKFISSAEKIIEYKYKEKIDYVEEGITNWYLEENYQNIFDGVVTGALTLYGKLKEYKVKIVEGETESEIVVLHNDKIKGYDELYSDKECTKLFDDVVTSDLTLYVKTITQDQGSGCNSGMKLWTLFMLMSLLFVNLLKKNYNK